ncbi:hypothetical protein [Limnothrix redekei]|uniref:Uncharacterized protein n=1 Tax=Limnothrix redekei LRLZ20PSL1 TaxID=3112953 RepID=A0ABW7C6C5_9CYAN
MALGCGFDRPVYGQKAGTRKRLGLYEWGGAGWRCVKRSTRNQPHSF